MKKLCYLITFLSVYFTELIYGLDVKEEDGRYFESKFNCVYLKPSRELDCVCPNFGQHERKIPKLFPITKLSENSTDNIASIKLHSCQNLKLSVDLTELERPFYRLRIEDVTNITVQDVRMLPNDTVDIWFRNIGNTLEILGDIRCDNCTAEEKNELELNIHVLDVLKVKIKKFNMLHNCDNNNTRIQLRNSDSIIIQDSYFNGLNKDSLEIFNADYVEIFHSEFHNSTNSSILINNVSNITIRESILDKQIVELLNNATSELNWKCSNMSPLMTDNEDLISCFSQDISMRSDIDIGVESQGAIVLTIVSSVILLLAVGILCMMNKTGRLDQYL